jgi:hypothetical protein
MTPGPSLQDMIATVQADAASAEALDQLSAAAEAVAELEGVADATLGHFVDQCRRAGHSWTEISEALGVTKQAAHKRFSPPPSMDRFTPRASAILTAAPEEARRLGHSYVGTEHVLLAIASDTECLATKVLTALGVTHARIEAELLEITPRGTAGPAGSPPFTPRAAVALQRTLTVALELGHNYVGTEHMLLALFADSESLASHILLALGANDEVCRRQIIAHLAGLGGDTPSA